MRIGVWFVSGHLQVNAEYRSLPFIRRHRLRLLALKFIS